jgi:hypothetical protein
LQKRAVTPFALPPLQFDLPNVFDKEGLDNRDAFAFHPLVVAGLGAVGVCHGFERLRFGHGLSLLAKM